MRIIDGTTLTFLTGEVTGPELHIHALQPGDIIVAYVYVVLDAPVLLTPTYSCALRDVVLVHAVQDSESPPIMPTSL